MRPIPVLLITHNRLPYSMLAFQSIVSNPGLPIRLTIWDNDSSDGTSIWLEYLEHPAIERVIRSKSNVGLAPAMNWFFRENRNEPYVVKVDNDTVMPDGWLADLMTAMVNTRRVEPKLGGVSGTCLRPHGLTWDEWVKASMTTVPFREHNLHFNTYILGTGVLINMDMIRERGQLFEHFPADASSDDLKTPCLISGWTAYTREACEFEGWKFAFYSKVPVNLLNIKTEHVLSNDFPEYDRKVQRIRDGGNAWWDSVGGLPGVRQFVAEHGGLEPLFRGEEYCPPQPEVESTPTSILTEADNLNIRSSFAFWDQRVKENGTTRSTFLDTPQARINEFTEHHMEFLRQYARDRNVLDVGCGWGRLSYPIAQLANTYIGVDFIPELIAKAEASMPNLNFQVADVKDLPFGDGEFDLIVGITCLSSFASVFDKILPELKRVLRHDGKILFLEENFVRIDWKLKQT